MRSVTFDLHAALFAFGIIAVVTSVAGVVYLWTPVLAHFAKDEDPVAVLTGGNEGEEASEEELDIAVLLEELAQDASSASGGKTFQYVPLRGRFVVVDLVTRELSLFQDGSRRAVYPIVRAANSSTVAVPEGHYTVSSKTDAEVSTLAMVRFPYYIRFGSYALHGVPTQASGEPFDGERGDGSITLADNDITEVFAFVAEGTQMYVRASQQTPPYGPYTKLVVTGEDMPATSAKVYAVADLSQENMLLSKASATARPMASITKLFTAVVASELIEPGSEVRAPNGRLYTVGDLFYPLLLRSDNGVAARLAAHVDTQTFMDAMNTYVQALELESTSFRDSSGLSQYNVTTAEDLVAFARHLYYDKRFVLDVSKEPTMTITSSDGAAWKMTNQNKVASDPYFVGGKLGFTDEARQTAVSIFNIPFNEQVHTIAVVILGSQDWKQDTRTLIRWLLENVELGA